MTEKKYQDPNTSPTTITEPDFKTNLVQDPTTVNGDQDRTVSFPGPARGGWETCDYE